MQNFAGQSIDKGCYVIQIARTAQGVRKRVGLVTGTHEEDEVRLIWCTPDNEFELTDGHAPIDFLVKVDVNTLSPLITGPLYYAKMRGHAKF